MILVRLAILLTALFAALPAQAAVVLEPGLCMVASGAEAGLAEALARRGECSHGDRSLAGPRIWVFADMSGRADTTENAVLIGDASAFGGLIVNARTADGNWHSRRYSPDDIVRHWRAGDRYAVPLPDRTQALALAVDRPWHSSNIDGFELSSRSELSSSHYELSLLYALFIGIMIVPIIYNLLFFAVMRERFMLWHIGMAIGGIGYAVFSSGIVFQFWPALSLDSRWNLDLLSITIGVCSMAMFCRYFLERRAMSPLVWHGLAAATVPMLVSLLLVTLGGEAIRPVGDHIYLISFAPALVLFFVAIGQGLWRGSRAARFQAAAWTPLLLCGADRIARGFGVYDGPDILNFVVYFTLPFETVVTALGIADRVMTIRRERDLSHERERVLSALAETDELTGLHDRRGITAAFDHGRDTSAFAIIDIDHFKQVNDVHGHEMGDRVLQSVGVLLKNWEGITAGRLGGEEFVVYFHGPRSAAAAERLQRAITIAIARDVPGLDRTVTACMGVVGLDPGTEFVDAYRASDKCLYRAKQAGRNRVEFGAGMGGMPALARAAA